MIAFLLKAAAKRFIKGARIFTLAVTENVGNQQKLTRPQQPMLKHRVVKS
jgi:hypothetical protein